MADITITATDIKQSSGVKLLQKNAGEAFSIGHAICINRSDNSRLYKSDSDDIVNTYRNFAIGISISAPVAAGQPANYAGTPGDTITFGAGILEQGMIYCPSVNAGRICPISDYCASVVINKALTTNVATLTTAVDHTIPNGSVIKVSGVDSTFNGTYTVSGVTSNTISYPCTHGDIASTAASGLLYQKSLILIPFAQATSDSVLKLLARTNGVAR